MAIRPSGRRRSGAVLRTLPSDSTCRSRTPTRDAPTALTNGAAGGTLGNRPRTIRSRLRARLAIEAPIVVGQRVGPDLEIGSRIGEHHIEGDPSRPGIQEPVDQAGPYRLEQRPRKRRKLGSRKRRIVDGNEHGRHGRDVAAPGLGDLQRQIVEQAVRAAERREDAAVVGQEADQPAHRDEQRAVSIPKAASVSNAPVAEIHQSDLTGPRRSADRSGLPRLRAAIFNSPAIALLDDEQVRLAIIERRRGHIAVERRHDRPLRAIPERYLADRLRPTIDDLDARPQRHLRRRRPALRVTKPPWKVETTGAAHRSPRRDRSPCRFPPSRRTRKSKPAAAHSSDNFAFRSGRYAVRCSPGDRAWSVRR